MGIVVAAGIAVKFSPLKCIKTISMNGIILVLHQRRAGCLKSSNQRRLLEEAI
jgi:hypothetical protein